MFDMSSRGFFFFCSFSLREPCGFLIPPCLLLLSHLHSSLCAWNIVFSFVFLYFNPCFSSLFHLEPLWCFLLFSLALLFSLCSTCCNCPPPPLPRHAEKWTMICLQRTPGKLSRGNTMYPLWFYVCVCVCVCVDTCKAIRATEGLLSPSIILPLVPRLSGNAHHLITAAGQEFVSDCKRDKAHMLYQKHLTIKCIKKQQSQNWSSHVIMAHHGREPLADVHHIT